MSCCFGGQKRSKGDRKTEKSKIPQVGQEKQGGRQSRKLANTSRININMRESMQASRDMFEGQEMRKSKLLQKIDVMDFKLDDPEGISHTPYINTFRYESILSHNILAMPRKPSSSQVNP